MPDDRALRNHILYLLRGGGAHLGFDEVMSGFPAPMRGVKPPETEHSAWQILEHMRIAQWDILEFSRNSGHSSPKFPEGYWPSSAAPPDESAWERSVAAFRADLRAMEQLVDGNTDLFARLRHPQAQAEHTLLREALLAADHNAYHLGQIVLLRRLLGAWRP